MPKAKTMLDRMYLSIMRGKDKTGSPKSFEQLLIARSPLHAFDRTRSDAKFMKEFPGGVDGLEVNEYYGPYLKSQMDLMQRGWGGPHAATEFSVDIPGAPDGMNGFSYDEIQERLLLQKLLKKRLPESSSRIKEIYPWEK